MTTGTERSAPILPLGMDGARVKVGRVMVRRAGIRKVVLILLVLAVVAIGVLLALAPVIASRLAPGMIAGVGKSMKGSLKVRTVSFGWFSPASVQSLQIIDEQGVVAADVNVATDATLSKVVGQRWWSAKLLDFGTITVSGNVAVINEPDGTSNLQRALEPRTPTPASPTPAKTPGPASGAGPSGGGTGPNQFKALLKLDKVDATVKDRKADGTFTPEQGVKGLAGELNLDFTNAGPIVAKGSLSGASVGGSAGAPSATKVDVDAMITQTPSGIEGGTAKLTLTGAPMSLIDGIGGLGGALTQGVGPSADIVLDASGTMSAADARVDIRSAGVNGNLQLALKDGVLSAAAPAGSGGVGTTPGRANTITVASLEFLGLLPQLRGQVASTGKQVRLTKAPSAEFSIESLRVPVGKPGAGFDAKTMDLRGASAVLKARLSEMGGQVELDSDGTGGQPAQWKPFAVAPVEVTIDAPDFSKPIKVTAGTTATLEGKSAGDIAIEAIASGMLDGSGHLRALSGGSASIADDLSASVKVAGVNTALVQPLVTGMELPLDLGMDLGPTLDLNVVAKTSGVPGAGGASAALPPMDVNASVRSANASVDGVVRLDKGVLTTAQGKGVSVKVASAAPLAQRVLAAQGADAPATVGGRGQIELTINDLSAKIDALKGATPLKELAGTIGLSIADLSVTPRAAPGTAPAQPVVIESSKTTLVLAPGKAPALQGQAALRHENTPFSVTEDLTIDGLAGGSVPTVSGLGAIDAFAVSGTIGIKGLPRSVANVVPGAAQYGTGPLPSGQAGQIADMVRGLVGATADINLRLIAADANKGGGRLTQMQVTTAAQGVSLDAWVRTSATAVEISSMSLWAKVDPAKVNPILAASADGGASDPASKPMRLEQPFKVYALIEQPAMIPLKAGAGGSVEPDFAAAKNLTLRMPVEGDVVLSNIPGGASGNQTVRISNLNLSADVPLSGLGGEALAAAARVKAKASAEIKDGGGKQAAVLAADMAAAMNGSSPEALIKLAQVNSSVIDGVLGRPGLVTGALGETADVTVQAAPSGKTVTGRVEIVAPKLTGAKLAFVQDPDSVRLTEPATINWRPDASFLNGLLAPPGGKDGPRGGAGGGGMTVTQTAPVVMVLNRLAVSMSKAGTDTTPEVGPLKPGVFDLDLSLTTASLGVQVKQEGSSGGGAGGRATPAQNVPLTLEGIRVTARKTADALPGVDADIGIDKIIGGTNTAAGSSIKAKVTNLADARGVLTTSAAAVNADAKMTGFPTPLIDQLANQGGLLSELLGPTIDLTLRARNLSQAKTGSGNLDVTAVSPRANAKIKGDIKDGAFIQDGVVDATLIEIRPQLIQKLSGGVPLVESVEKTKEDKPALLTTEGLRAPIDGDLRKLNGQVKVDLGVARFTTKSVLGDLIKAAGGKAGGSVGQKIEPFVVNIKDGVATYDQFALPIGEFKLQTKGTVDLVQRQVNVVTYVPFFALTDEALGAFKVGFGGNMNLIDRNTLVPITTKGSLDNPKTGLDMGLFAKETGDKLLKEPGKIIGNVLDDLLKPKPKKK